MDKRGAHPKNNQKMPRNPESSTLTPPKNSLQNAIKVGFFLKSSLTI